MFFCMLLIKIIFIKGAFVIHITDFAINWIVDFVLVRHRRSPLYASPRCPCPHQMLSDVNFILEDGFAVNTHVR